MNTAQRRQPRLQGSEFQASGVCGVSRNRGHMGAGGQLSAANGRTWWLHSAVISGRFSLGIYPRSHQSAASPAALPLAVPIRHSGSPGTPGRAVETHQQGPQTWNSDVRQPGLGAPKRDGMGTLKILIAAKIVL